MVTDSIAANPRTRRFQFGLRAILTTIALLALLLAALDYSIVSPYRDEQRAAAALVALGGKVLLVEDTESWIPRHMGTNFFDKRVAAIVDLSHSQLTDSDLVHLRAFGHCGQLNLAYTLVSDAGLEQISHVVGGRFIDLSHTQITNVSRLLSGRPRDQPLGLKFSGNRIAPGAFGFSAGPVWTPLQELDLSDSDAGDQTLEEFPGMVNLSKLDLSGTDVTDAGLDRLLKLEGLTRLGLSRTKVTADGVSRLKSLWKGRLPLTITTGPGPSPIVNYAELPKRQ